MSEFENNADSPVSFSLLRPQFWKQLWYITQRDRGWYLYCEFAVMDRDRNPPEEISSQGTSTEIGRAFTDDNFLLYDRSRCDSGQRTSNDSTIAENIGLFIL